MQPPETRYAKTPDGVYLAFQVVGDGPVDVACGFNSDEGNVDLIWEEPDWSPFLAGTAEFARLILHDRRGTGVSSRNVPPPNLETQVSDLLTVLDVAESAHAILIGGTEGGAMHAMFAATHPDRVAGLVWNNPAGRMAWATDYPWGMGPREFERALRDAEAWGMVEYGRAVADWRTAERTGVPLSELGSVEHDPVRLHTYAKINRNTASPDVALEINRIFWETDVRGILPSVQAPTALITGDADDVEEARYVASLMPNATVHVLQGRSGVAVGPFLDITRELAGIEMPVKALDTVLSTVLFTDIVGSTAKQAALGDGAWKELLERHHAMVRHEIDRWHGAEVDTAGDGFYATFEGPARAVRCALDIGARVRELGLEIRAGVHVGECTLIDGKVGGLPVTIGARIAARSVASEVLVSQTVKDLVAGSGLTFEDAGEHELKGIPGRWHLYRVVR